jgi:hypothetical protein
MVLAVAMTVPAVFRAEQRGEKVILSEQSPPGMAVEIVLNNRQMTDISCERLILAHNDNSIMYRSRTETPSQPTKWPNMIGTISNAILVTPSDRCYPMLC